MKKLLLTLMLLPMFAFAQPQRFIKGLATDSITTLTNSALRGIWFGRHDTTFMRLHRDSTIIFMSGVRTIEVKNDALKSFVGNAWFGGAPLTTTILNVGGVNSRNIGQLRLHTDNLDHIAYTYDIVSGLSGNNQTFTLPDTTGTFIVKLNGISNKGSQFFATGTSGTDFNVSSSGAVHTFNIPDASSTARGLVNTGTQSFIGDKTFGGSAISTTTLSIGGVNTRNTGQLLLFSDNLDHIPYTYTITTSLSSANRTFTLPNKSGTFAMTSDITSIGLDTLNGLFSHSQTLVTGTSGSNFNISSTGSTHTFNLPSASATALGLVDTSAQSFHGDKRFGGYAVSTTTLSIGGVNTRNTGQLRLYTDNLDHIAYTYTITSGLSSANRTFTLPDADGTIALNVPSGIIVMWSGSIASIPTGWVLCDGTNGTPDLRSKFIVGARASGGYAVNATGGVDSVQLITAQIPSHTHTFSGIEHGHAITDPGHNHSYNWFGVDNPSVQYTGGMGSVFGASISTGSSTTGITVRGETGTGTNSSTGGGGYHENRPPYYALAYIMKL